jgi:hypothetical protein
MNEDDLRSRTRRNMERFGIPQGMDDSTRAALRAAGLIEGASPLVHDMAEGYWGRHIEWLRPGEKLTGHMTPKPEVGDEVRSPMHSGRTGIYRITNVEPMLDPPDMFFATVEWIGYLDEPVPDVEGGAS